MRSIPTKPAGLLAILALVAVPASHAFAQGAPRKTGATPAPASLFQLPGGNAVDLCVLDRLRAEGLPPSEACTDATFLRRVHLDLAGTLPTAKEAREFLADKSPRRRAELVERLLASEAYADYWAMKWGDWLRVKSEFPSNLWPNAVQTYHKWLRDRMRDNTPYDRFVRELLTATGSNFRSPPANFLRAFQERTPQAIAGNVALVFMGVRADNPALAAQFGPGFHAFFAQLGYKNTDEWKEEIVFFDPAAALKDASGAPVPPTFPDGRRAALAPGADPREAFADWLTAPGNPWFARAIVNRLWACHFGRGIVHEPDDFRPDNPAWSPALLNLLERELVTHKYDLRHLHRLILNSETYRRSSAPNAWNRDDERGFSHYRLRRLEAETVVDAVCLVTGGTEKYTSSIPEPFTYLPDDQKAVAIADGSIVSPFLETFGRPARNTSFDSERANTPSAIQAQYLLNSTNIQQKLARSGALRALASSKTTPDKIVEELYLRILSRPPTPAEAGVAVAHLKANTEKRAEAVTDLAWALLNTKEFILKH